MLPKTLDTQNTPTKLCLESTTQLGQLYLTFKLELSRYAFNLEDLVVDGRRKQRLQGYEGGGIAQRAAPAVAGRLMAFSAISL